MHYADKLEILIFASWSLPLIIPIIIFRHDTEKMQKTTVFCAMTMLAGCLTVYGNILWVKPMPLKTLGYALYGFAFLAIYEALWKFNLDFLLPTYGKKPQIKRGSIIANMCQDLKFLAGLYVNLVFKTIDWSRRLICCPFLLRLPAACGKEAYAAAFRRYANLIARVFFGRLGFPCRFSILPAGSKIRIGLLVHGLAILLYHAPYIVMAYAFMAEARPIALLLLIVWLFIDTILVVTETDPGTLLIQLRE